MKVLFLLSLTLLTEISLGQKKEIIDPQIRELIKNDFLTSFYRELDIEFQSRQRDVDRWPLPYFIGDEFILQKPMTIGVRTNIKDSLSFDFYEPYLIPKNHKIKLLKKEGLFYFIEVKDTSNLEVRHGIIGEEPLKTYFDPDRITSKALFYDNYEKLKDRIAEMIGKKYEIFPHEAISIIESSLDTNHKKH